MTAHKQAQTTLWQDRVERAQTAFFQTFWDERRQMFHNLAPELPEADQQFNYWWQAHAFDLLVDGYERTGNAVYAERIASLYGGLLERNGGDLINAFYDDMAWMALALLRAYDATGETRYADASKELWAFIKTGWNSEQGGGIAWKTTQLDYKNTPANAPVVILAGRLYKHFGNEDDLVWVLKIYTWLTDTLVDPTTGYVWDGVNRQGDGVIDKEWAFTYNQGTFIGASVTLYRVTGEAHYLAAAYKTATSALERFTDNTGVFMPEGDGDGSLFRGILMRYLTLLVAADPTRQAIIVSLLHNAEVVWEASDNQLVFAEDWREPLAPYNQLGTQVSSLTLLEGVARLERTGALTEMVKIP